MTDRRLVIQEPTFRLEFTSYGTTIRFRGLPDDRDTVHSADTFISAIMNLPQYVYHACETPTEVEHYMAGIRDYVGRVLYDKHLLEELGVALGRLIVAEGVRDALDTSTTAHIPAVFDGLNLGCGKEEG